ncbi:hypothetical protein HNP55_004366 [Paucibacter oligotrophus]|uniref:Uncharacterized protein n=1 Tax=Roseateles oligotrophus TaxID=1769250 RepID=A0A840LB52_9BURK|nr:hypothetical protein [Roseateles oligotrophus]MBB4845814.1 hypothetical protein [Roseateles oligotrophus]
MKASHFFFFSSRPILALALGLSALAAWASSGAHGPNGEHLDAQAPGTAAVSSAPRLEARSELFELVARLDGGELSILIDRYASNEPLLGADVELESGPLKAKAKFHADLGDYAVDDPALLKLLSTPGEHPLIITVLAGAESDLLDGVLHVAAGTARDAAHGPGGDQGPGSGWWRWALGAAILLLLVLSWKWRDRSSGDALASRLNGEQA